MRTGKQIITWPLVLLAISLMLSASSQADEPTLGQLIKDRLDLMDEVAAYKYLNNLPIEDIEREKVVIAHAISSGLEFGIKKESSAVFFTRQIDAAKEIQQFWFDQWLSKPPPSESPDLKKIIRPELIRLGNAISQKLLNAEEISAAEFINVVEIKGLSIDTTQSLYEAVSNIESYDNRLQQILDAGTLRVGTTGDYAPFSNRSNRADPYTGIDIDLAQDLATSLGVKLQLVETSWPTLLQDLNANRYDIAMSGVSRNLERQKVGFFSAAYHTGGKTPITLCKNINRFNTLKKIDVPATRVIVNPGGTNERFVDSELKHAQKVLHLDNRTIFKEIVNGNVDLMITDNIEVRLQSSNYSELCAAMPKENLTFQEKGFLMPQDVKLKEYVDLWLITRKGDGTIRSTFDQYLQ
jgi:cyclohexadienyl dehydratase